MVGLGLREAMTLPLIAEADLERCGLSTDATVRATNALNAEEPVLRPAILPGLLRAAARNTSYGLADLAFFEMGHVFRMPPEGQILPDERDHLAVVLTGNLRRAPAEPDRPIDVYDATDILGAVVDALGLADAVTQPADHPGYRSGAAASVVVDGVGIGVIGELDPVLLRSFRSAAPAVALELDLDGLLAGSLRDRAFRPLSTYPAATVDLAFVLDESTAAATVVATLRAAGGEVIEDVHVFDEFRAESLGADRRSLALALRFRAPDRTLGDKELAKLRRRCIDAVVREHGGELRARQGERSSGP